MSEDFVNSLSLEECRSAAKKCACFNIRKVSRAITLVYDEALRPTGLRSGQFALLVCMRLKGAATIQEMAEAVMTDRSALSRNVRPLISKGLVGIEQGQDRRTRRISITPLGLETLGNVYPFWQQGQEKVRELLGQQGLDELLSVLKSSQQSIRQDRQKKGVEDAA